MTDFAGLLFARPSFWEGAARLLDLGDTLTEYNQSITPEQADSLAFRADARAVAQDMRAAAREFEASLVLPG
jgi:hypothetical protein